jgi:hypothetical protein
MENLIELSENDQLHINGGNQTSYDYGYRFGTALHNALDWVGWIAIFAAVA